MHKKLESDLISLAHSILQMKNKDNVFLLKQKSKEIYEKLSVLAFVEEYVNATPNLKETKSEILEIVETAYVKKDEAKAGVINEEVAPEAEEKIVYNLVEEPTEAEKAVEVKPAEPAPVKEEVKPIVEEEIEQPFAELEEMMFATKEPANNFKNDMRDVGARKTQTLEEELQDTISVDVMADLFENAQPKSLNDKLAGNIQIGLNDRITFVKNLFDGSQEDFNRVVSQLNTFKSEKDAKKFINSMVKPDYNWKNHADLETRFMEIIGRKFA